MTSAWGGQPWVAAALAALMTALVLPGLRRWFLRRGWTDAPGHRKIHAEPMSLAGGAALVAGWVVGWAWTMMDARAGGAGGGPAVSGLGPVGVGYLDLAVVLALFLLGFWDDLVELRPRTKLLGQGVVTVVVVAAGVRLPIAREWPLVQAFVSGLFFLALLNAVNFLDNMNGLCAGLGAVASCHLAVEAWGRRDGLAAAGAWALAGATLGFLPYNFPRARVFLGDAGSHVVGGLVTMMAMRSCAAGSMEAAGGAGLNWGALGVLLVPAVDLVQVVIRRWRRGHPVYVGDNEHLSHRLVRAGLTRAWAVAVLWLLSALAGCLAWWG